MLIINSLVTIHLAFVFYMCCSSVTQSRPSLCNPMDCSTPGLPVPHHLPKFTQVHVHCISDAIQSSHPLTLFSSAVNLPQHQRLFQWVGCSHQITKILELQLQHMFLLSTQGWFPLRLTALISLLSKGHSEVFRSTKVQRHQFFSTLLFLWSSSHNCAWPLRRP